MTELSFGKVYNASAIDLNSVVNMLGCPTDVVYLTQTISNPHKDGFFGYYKKPLYPIVFMDDDYGEREFALIGGDGKFKVYSVDTVTPAIILSSNTTFSHTDSMDYILGIKISASLYYIYYLNNTGDDTHYIRFRRIALVPGTGGTDTLLEQLDLARSDGNKHWRPQDVHIINRTAYLGLIETHVSNILIKIAIYSFDMDSESITGGVLQEWPPITGYDNPGPYIGGYLFDGSQHMALTEKDGELNWCIGYIHSYYQDNPYYGFVNINGAETKVTGILPARGTTDYWGESIQLNAQYNSRDSMVSVVFAEAYPYTGRYTTTVVNGVIYETVSGAITVIPYAGKLRNPNIFPTLAFNYADSKWYFINKNTGESVSEFTLSGVTSIYNVFPKLGDYGGNIFANVLVSGVQKLVSIDPVSYTVNKTYNVVFPKTDYMWSFNHGNFYLQWIPNYTDSDLYVTYLINLVGKKYNQIIMMPYQPV